MLFQRSVFLLSLIASASAAPWQSWGTGSWSIWTSVETGWAPSATWTPSSTTAAAVPTTTAASVCSTHAPSPTSASSDYSACATVSSLVAAAAGTARPQIPAQIAWDCAQSVPLNTTSGLRLMKSIRPYLDWQTTLAYLKHPPAGYVGPTVDVLGEYDSIVSKLQCGGFANEYEFEFALYEMFQSPRDEHFRYFPSLVSGVFFYGRTHAMVSVSANGKALPQPYVYEDILLSVNDTSFVPSVVSQIDGQDALTYLENWAQYSPLQDPDAAFNDVMFQLPQVSLGDGGDRAGTFSGGGYAAYIYPGATTTLTFENGTTTSYDNFAHVLQDFVGIENGEDLYITYLDPPPSASSTLSTSTSATSTSTPAPGYPTPVILQQNNLVGGYYLNETGYKDVAVLSVPSFVNPQSTEQQSFQKVAGDFIAAAVAAGKTKLIVDLSGNGGGTVLQAYNLFKNLFPDIEPYGATRFRAHEAFNIIGEVVSDIAGPYPWNNNDPTNVKLNDFLDTSFDYSADVDINGDDFQSWSQKYGPHEFYGDNFTSIIRRNLSDPTDILTEGITVDGYLNRNNTPASTPFAAENIVILSDGYCASTCAVFSELMTSQGGVKTIAIGGRPLEQPMQAVGGTKGTNDWGWDFIHQIVNDTLTLADNSTVATAAELEAGVLGTYDMYWNVRNVKTYSAMNVRDGIAQGDASETPLNFVYQPADCRLWFTKEMTIDMMARWTTVADVAWHGASCAVGDVGLSGSNNAARDTWSTKEKEKRATKPKVSASHLAELKASLDLYTGSRARVVGGGRMRP